MAYSVPSFCPSVCSEVITHTDCGGIYHTDRFYRDSIDENCVGWGSKVTMSATRTKMLIMYNGEKNFRGEVFERPKGKR
jgi:hypothetical protein